MYQTIILLHFLRQFKHLSKKFRTLKHDLIIALEKFDPDQHIHLGKDVYKVRLHSRSLTRGKSKSLRLIVLVIRQDSFLVPITIYFKGDQADISQKEVNDQLNIILLELRRSN